MKRLVLLMIVLVTTMSVAGCQSRGFGKRGARCNAQPGAPMFAPQQPQQQMQMPGCNQGCNSGAQSGAVVMPGGNVVTDGMQTAPMGNQQFQSGQVIQGSPPPVVVDRQIVPGSVTVRDAETGSVITVPGPESAPLPRS